MSKPRVDPKDLELIITGPEVESARKLVEVAQEWGRYLKSQDLSTSQIRGVFGQVRLIEMNWPAYGDNEQRAQAAERELILLKPKLAYQGARDEENNRGKRRPVKDLADLLVPAIDLVQGSRECFQRFVNLFEAILAYHRAEGGK